MNSLRRSLPPLNALVVFEAVARHASLTRAAADLGIAQSAVSRHVENLAHHTGLALLRRLPRGIEVTDAGRRLAAAIAVGMGQIRDEIASLKRVGRPRQISFACSYDLAFLWLMPRFSQLRAMAPEMELRLVTSDSYLDFDAPDIDVSLRIGRGRWPDRTAVRLFPEEAFPIAAPRFLGKHPFLRNPQSLVDLARAPRLECEVDERGGLNWAGWFDQRGLRGPLPPPKATFKSYFVLLQAARDGEGVALGWNHLVDAYLSSSQLARLGSWSVESSYGYYLVCRWDERDADVMRLVRWLKKSVEAGSLAGEEARI